MDGFSMTLGIIIAFTGLYGLYFAASGRSAMQNSVTRFLFAIRRAKEPSRAFTALSSGLLVAFGAYCIFSSLRPGLPLWPSLVALLMVGALQLGARFQRHDIQQSVQFESASRSRRQTGSPRTGRLDSGVSPQPPASQREHE